MEDLAEKKKLETNYNCSYNQEKQGNTTAHILSSLVFLMQLKWLKKKPKNCCPCGIMKHHLSSDLQQVTDIYIYA